VTCRDIESLIITYTSGAVTPPEVAAHIAGCERCRRLVRALAEPPPVVSPPPDQLRRIEAGILADLKPVKPLPPAGVLWFALLFIFAVVVAVGGVALGAAGWRALSVLQRLAVFSALTAAAGLLAFSAGRQIVPGSKLLVSPYLSVVAVLAGIAGICTSLFHPHAESAFVSTGLVCLRIGLECAVPAALLLWLLLRRGAVLNPMLTGATAGALSGLSGLTVLEVFCPNLNKYHIVVWHLGAALASAAAGLAVGMIAEYSTRPHTRRTP